MSDLPGVSSRFFAAMPLMVSLATVFWTGCAVVVAMLHPHLLHVVHPFVRQIRALAFGTGLPNSHRA